MKNILMFYRLLRNKCYIWFPGYFSQQSYQRKVVLPEDKDIHLIVQLVDHFEPCRREGVLGVKKVREWCKKYEEIAESHSDSDSRFPQHTWFYRYDYPNYDCISILSEYVYNGFGEIEFHLHHAYDTPESFTEKIRQGIAWFNRVGAMISAEAKPQIRFGYIAGNWALDNGRRNAAYSGVNTELSILSEEGCYADFTFPAIPSNAQPRKVNSIYYAKDTPKPKSYNTGIDVKVGKQPSGDLMIFQGPLLVDWKRKYTESAAFESFAPYRPWRIDNWIRAGIHVIGRPEWIFVKLHTHGMQSRDAVLSDQLDAMLSDLERQFKNPPFSLHYVTSREAYNIVKAAEAGKSGNPNEYRSFIIPQPANSKLFCNQPYKLEKYSKDHVILKTESLSNDTMIKFKDLPLNLIRGDTISSIDLSYTNNSIKRLHIDGEGKCTLNYEESRNAALDSIVKKFNLPLKIDNVF